MVILIVQIIVFFEAKPSKRKVDDVDEDERPKVMKERTMDEDLLKEFGIKKAKLEIPSNISLYIFTLVVDY